MRITAPQLAFDGASDGEDDDPYPPRRAVNNARQRRKYREPPPSIREDDSKYTAFSAIVSAPIVRATSEQRLEAPRNECTDSDGVQGQTLLHLAATLGHEEIMHLLISETSHANTLLNARGQTPLLSAIEAGSTNTATLLMVQNPSSLTCKDHTDSGVFHYAAEHCNDIVLNRAISLLKRLGSTVARLTVSHPPVRVGNDA